MPATRSEGRPSAEPSSTPQPIEVAFVRAGRGGRAAIQEWRSRATGRIHEVPETQSYAPAVILQEGASGWLMYGGGVAWVGETKDEALRMTRRVSKGPPPLRGAASPRGSERPGVPWELIFVLALVSAVVWALAR